MVHPLPAPLRFGHFELDRASGDLRRRGLAVKLSPQTRSLLRLLVEPPIRTRSREEIQRRLWASNTFVDFDRGMNKVVHTLREALGESARSPRFIETVSSEGYRFITDVPEPMETIDSRAEIQGERVAVLPIRAEPRLSLVAGRVTTCLIQNLALISGLRVIAEGTVTSYNLDGMGPQQAGRVLGVAAVLSGRLQKKAHQLELGVELVDSADGALLGGSQAVWDANAATRREKDIAQEIVEELRERLEMRFSGRKSAFSELVP